MNVREILAKCPAVLESSGVPQSNRETALLLAFAIGKDRTFLIAYPEYELDDQELKRFEAVLDRRANREPFQYISGLQEFYGLDFEVGRDVLIPRPETEMVAAKAIELLGGLINPIFCEVGIGSGCIAVSVLFNVKNASAVGLDISKGALSIAELNAQKHQVMDRILFKESDIFSGLEAGQFDLIVSNPPYVPLSDFARLQPEVQFFEPYSSLTDGGDGLSVIGKIVAGAPAFLKTGGILLLEIGFNQAESVFSMFESGVWASIEIIPDFQSIPRMVVAHINKH